MTPGFLGSYVLGLLAVGLMLFGLYGIARLMTRARFSRGGRWLQVIESVPLGANCALHVVKAGERYLLIATGSGQVSLIGELGSHALLGSHAATVAWGRVAENPKRPVSDAKQR